MTRAKKTLTLLCDPTDQAPFTQLNPVLTELFSDISPKLHPTVPPASSAPLALQLRSTIVTSQIPLRQWHAAIGEPTLADAILDRLVQNA